MEGGEFIKAAKHKKRVTGYNIVAAFTRLRLIIQTSSLGAIFICAKVPVVS